MWTLRPLLWLQRDCWNEGLSSVWLPKQGDQREGDTNLRVHNCKPRVPTTSRMSVSDRKGRAWVIKKKLHQLTASEAFEVATSIGPGPCSSYVNHRVIQIRIRNILVLRSWLNLYLELLSAHQVLKPKPVKGQAYWQLAGSSRAFKSLLLPTESHFNHGQSFLKRCRCNNCQEGI